MKRIFNGSGGRKAALILSLCLIFALAVGTTVALLKANTAPVTNTFPGPTIFCTGSMLSVPRAMAAIAWAPPDL